MGRQGCLDFSSKCVSKGMICAAPEDGYDWRKGLSGRAGLGLGRGRDGIEGGKSSK